MTLMKSAILCFLSIGCKPPKGKLGLHGQILKAAPEARVAPSEAAEMADLALHAQREFKTAPHLAVLSPASGSNVRGLVLLIPKESQQKVRLVGWLSGLAAGGSFGFHIYEKGDCSHPEALSAGQHFNPTGSVHGDPSQENSILRGNLPQLHANQSGISRVDAEVVGVNLLPQDPQSIAGRSLIVHRDPDGYRTQPAGDSGPRFSCGVIVPEILD